MEVKAKQVVYHDWESAAYDDKWSIGFDERCVAYAAGRLERVVEPATRFDRVLEVGCGTGFFLLNLTQAGFVGDAHCTDISTGMIAACRDNARQLGMTVHARVADAERLPYPDGSFDLVVGHAVLHHLPDPAAALAEARRVLRPGGRVVIAGEPTLAGDRIAEQWKRTARVGVKLAAVVLGSERVLAPAPARHGDDARAAALEWEVDLHTFPPAALGRLARDAGFERVEVHTEELTANWFGWVTRTVESMVGRSRLPPGYPAAAYRIWRGLFAFDEIVTRRILPAGWCYNAILTGVAPAGPPAPGAATSTLS